MIVIAGILSGAIVGPLTARKRQGNRADMIQYGAVFAIAGGLLGLIVTIIVEKAFF